MMIDHGAFDFPHGVPEAELGRIDYSRHLNASRRLRSEAAHAYSAEARNLARSLARSVGRSIGSGFRARRHPFFALRRGCGCAETR